MSAAPLVDLRNLGRTFDVSKPWLNRLVERLPRQFLAAVTDVSFAIERRETFALVGESGSGKSTVAKMTVGLIAPTTGDVVIEGVSMNDPARHAARQRLRRRIQMVFQDPYASLNPRWRVRRIVAEPLVTYGLVTDKDELRVRVGELLEQVRLGAADGDKFPHEFSGGQRQRISIARALAANPEFLVCDEPTSALDVSVQAQTLNLMRDLQRRLRLTYLFISHNLAVIYQISDRVGVMYLGRLVEVATADQLFAAPRHPYTQLLLETIPRLDPPDDPSGEREPVAGEVPNPIDPPSGCAFHPRCPYSTDRCRQERPSLLAAAGALVACHAVQEGRLSFG